ncbi:hypothetical protein DL96DRAFT_1587054 [Flagelloscypha sp. PMI_526]|nr:hypothetical protein DL96DRAFT_1587054 [Flagelloscypha sp. PMI_526]
MIVGICRLFTFSISEATCAQWMCELSCDSLRVSLNYGFIRWADFYRPCRVRVSLFFSGHHGLTSSFGHSVCGQRRQGRTKLVRIAAGKIAGIVFVTNILMELNVIAQRLMRRVR